MQSQPPGMQVRLLKPAEAAGPHRHLAQSPLQTSSRSIQHARKHLRSAGSWAAASLCLSAGVALRRATRSQKRLALSRKVTLRAVAATTSKSMEQAVEKVEAVDFNKLESESLGELERIYIDALWWYFQENAPILSDAQFNKLKQELYKRESQFPALHRNEVAFIEAAIAYYRGEPQMPDEEYDALKKQIMNSDKSKEILAFVLFNKGENLLSSEEFQNLKEEAKKLGMAPVDLEGCTLAQLEEMYVDALWAYYNDGVQILTDEQYDKLRNELYWQGSGFPTLRSYEVQFVKAALAYWRGEAVLSDEKWKELKAQVKADEERQDVTAFLLYTKGKQQLPPETFDKMATEMSRLGVNVRREGIDFRAAALKGTSDEVKDDVGGALQMYTALSVIPIILTTLLLWAAGIAADTELVPDLELESIFSEDSIPLLIAGPTLGLFLTAQLVNFLDLGGQVLKSTCPACGARVRHFVGSVEKKDTELKTKCQNCGNPISIDWKNMKVVTAGIGSKMEADPDAMDWATAWKEVTSKVQKKTDGKVKQLDPYITFQIWNKSGTGVLNLSEFREAFKSLGIQVSQKEIDALFRSADTNGDGTIDYEEFFTIYNAAGAAGKFSRDYLRDTFSNLIK